MSHLPTAAHVHLPLGRARREPGSVTASAQACERRHHAALCPVERRGGEARGGEVGAPGGGYALRTATGWLALWSMMLVGPALAVGSELSIVEVLQPIDIENCIQLASVTYTTFNSDDPGVLAVGRTCDSNAVVGDSGPRNLNAAFNAGLRLRVVFNSDREPPLFGDTLRVVLDARGLRDLSPVSDWSDSTILAATIQCVIVNAAQCKEANFAEVRVDGPVRLRQYGGVYRTRRYRSGPLQRVFR